MQFLDYILKARSHSSNEQSLTETKGTQVSEIENLLMSDDTQHLHLTNNLQHPYKFHLFVNAKLSR